MSFPNCNGCKNRNKKICLKCVGWDRYESNGLYVEHATDISKELDLIAKRNLNMLFGIKSKERDVDMEIKKVIFNDSTTIILWGDGTKTVVKCGEDDIYDPEKGLAMAIAKKALGNKGNYYEIFKKWIPK